MSKTLPKEKINGVDVQRLEETIAAIHENPRQAQFQFCLNNQWKEGSTNQSAIQNFKISGAPAEDRKVSFTLNCDEPDLLLGKDQAPNPAEYLLHALAACMTTSLAFHAAAQGIKLDKVESTLEGDMDLRGFTGLAPEIRPGYKNIRAKFNIVSDATREELKNLMKFSPIFDTVSHPVPIEVDVTTVSRK